MEASIFFVIGSLFALMIVVYYVVWSRSRFVRLINAIPGPDAMPILGNILELNVTHDGM
jgi:cytochrome P450 family 4